MIDQITAQKIKDTADIVDVVGDYVHLVRRGANYMGLCPFHNERTPSFSVNKRKNFCYCFSCKKGGSPVNFIMEKEGLSYHDALLHLAKRYGIEVVEKELTDEEREAQSEREAMLVANEWAMLKMEKDLLETSEGRDIGLSYLYGRGVTEDAIRKFHLGYAIDRSSELTSAAKSAGYNIDVLKNLGLVGTSKEGREYDRFRGRVIFPIINSAGKVIAFGGRDLKGGLAKYINSPESQIYKKSNELYGIYQARADIVKEDKCFLVEGYLDVIGMWQSGMRNTVASSGTALTDGQIALIHRFTENITLIYDGDQAGIKASLRGIDMLLSHKMKVKVLLLPDGDDPDSFARKHTPEEFRNYVSEHETDIIRFKAQVLLSDVKSDPQKRIEALNSVVESIAHIPDPISRDVYIQECATILGVQENSIAKSVARFRASLVEKWKRDQNKQAYPVSGRNEETSGASQSTDRIDNSQPAPLYGPQNDYTQSVHSQSKKADPYPLLPLEKVVIEYCIKYGFLELCSLIDEEEELNQSISVLDYVKEELEADSINFSVPVYAKIFSLLIDMRDLFDSAATNYSAILKEEIDTRRKEGIANIGAADLSLSEIEKEEKKLETELEKYFAESIREFAKDYPGKELASHELGDVRSTAIELIRERHQLSHIYMRDNNVIEKEEDKLELLVPRAMTEWKNELLNIRIKNLFTQFREISGKGDTEAENRIMLEINNLMRIRSQVAKDIGERIISPKINK
ncbi:MAG: DNA primase [Muribaculaceae bacterium]|nr:DNA primase [Muribaculaceae bacterium]